MYTFKLDKQEFPTLTDVIDWGPVRSNFTITDKITNLSLVSNVSIIPCVGDHYVMIQLENGKWELPGGTLEPGEHYLDGLRREVMEEVGAELLDYRLIGEFFCESNAEQPFRPHIPHPLFIRLLGYGEVRLVRKPLNPEDGEQVTAVEVVDIAEAVRRFQSIERHDIAEMYKLAHRIRISKSLRRTT